MCMCVRVRVRDVRCVRTTCIGMCMPRVHKAQRTQVQTNGMRWLRRIGSAGSFLSPPSLTHVGTRAHTKGTLQDC